MRYKSSYNLLFIFKNKSSINSCLCNMRNILLKNIITLTKTINNLNNNRFNIL